MVSGLRLAFFLWLASSSAGLLLLGLGVTLLSLDVPQWSQVAIWVAFVTVCVLFLGTAVVLRRAVRMRRNALRELRDRRQLVRQLEQYERDPAGMPLENN